MTLVQPGTITDRGESNRNEYFSNDSWKIKGDPKPLDLKPPEQFPLREYINYLQQRSEEAAKVESQPIKRPCHDHQPYLIQELNAKKELVMQANLDDKEKLELARQRLLDSTKELKMAVVNDMNAQKLARLIEDTQTRKVIRPVEKPPMVQVKPRLYVPYMVSVVLRDDEAEQAPSSQENGSAANRGPATKGSDSPKTVFIRLGEGERNFGMGEDKPRINLYSLLRELMGHEETRQKDGTEFVMVMPKAFTFGDDEPRKISYSEYASNFAYFRVDPRNIADFLARNNIKPDENMTLERIRDLVSTLGLPLKTEKERSKYRKMLDTERERQTRLESAKAQAEEERRMRREEKERRQDEWARDMQAEEEGQRARVAEKQRAVSSHLRSLNEQREMERARKSSENAFMRLTREQQRKYLELYKIVYREFVRPIVRSAMQSIFPSTQQLDRSTSISGPTREPPAVADRPEGRNVVTPDRGISGPEELLLGSEETIEVVECSLRGVQTPAEWYGPEEPLCVGVESEAQPRRAGRRILRHIMASMEDLMRDRGNARLIEGMATVPVEGINGDPIPGREFGNGDIPAINIIAAPDLPPQNRPKGPSLAKRPSLLRSKSKKSGLTLDDLPLQSKCTLQVMLPTVSLQDAHKDPGRPPVPASSTPVVSQPAQVATEISNVSAGVTEEMPQSETISAAHMETKRPDIGPKPKSGQKLEQKQRGKKGKKKKKRLPTSGAATRSASRKHAGIRPGPVSSDSAHEVAAEKRLEPQVAEGEVQPQVEASPSPSQVALPEPEQDETTQKARDRGTSESSSNSASEKDPETEKPRFLSRQRRSSTQYTSGMMLGLVQFALAASKKNRNPTDSEEPPTDLPSILPPSESVLIFDYHTGIGHPRRRKAAGT